MTIEDQPPRFELAFFAVCHTADAQGYIGATLVTNERGAPSEFRCTHPVRPNAVQKAMYGKSLESHIGLELCGKPLLNSLTTNPLVCLVDAPEMVDLNELVSLPVLCVQRLGELITATGAMPAEDITQRLDSQSGNFEPVLVNCHPRRKSDLEQIRPSLEHAFQYVDLLEPFERITTSLSVLAARDERFR